jgi:thiosulfate/3-mercaptopyruvate sulfurtransferase
MIRVNDRLAAVLILALPALGRGESGPPPRPPLVAHDALQGRLGDRNLRLLDARPKADYEKGHIPGAVWVDAKAVQAMAARPGGLTDRAAWEAWLAPLGIAPGSEVLVYDDQRQREAARIWWLLRYLGLDRVGLIDGHFPYWQASGRPVTSEAPKVAPRPVNVAFRADRHATRQEVLATLKGGATHVIDARSRGEYSGEAKMARRGGHIPAACHLEWSELVDKDGRILDPSALRAKLSKLGIKPGEPVITHCQSGGRASVDAFALERLGLPTRNYYLGWSDWGNAEQTPVATGAAAKP